MKSLQLSSVEALKACIYSSRDFEFDRVFDPLVGLNVIEAPNGYTHGRLYGRPMLNS